MRSRIKYGMTLSSSQRAPLPPGYIPVREGESARLLLEGLTPRVEAPGIHAPLSGACIPAPPLSGGGVATDLAEPTGSALWALGQRLHFNPPFQRGI